MVLGNELQLANATCLTRARLHSMPNVYQKERLTRYPGSALRMPMPSSTHISATVSFFIETFLRKVKVIQSDRSR
jgi:hypothetical protein